jgi:hypothetical protein
MVNIISYLEDEGFKKPFDPPLTGPNDPIILCIMEGTLEVSGLGARSTLTSEMIPGEFIPPFFSEKMASMVQYRIVSAVGRYFPLIVGSNSSQGVTP